MANNTSGSTTSNRNQLTDKELHYMKDFLSWELLAIKKCNDAATRCQDQQIMTMIKSTGQKHQQQYNQLLTFLQ
jgi:hypothetical protein